MRPRVLKICMRTTIAVCLAAFFSAAASGQTFWWNKDFQARRAVTVWAPEMNLPGDDAAVVTFYTGGHLEADGSDIRVVARGRQVPHLLFGVGPGDTATIAFKAEKGVRDCHIYFGNKNAGAPKYDWEPQRGLILQTRGFGGGDPKNLPAMRAILKRAEPFYGAAAVDRIWHGQNMFGPPGSFVSMYVGWLVCTTPGQYAFATTSDDASFLLVDGKEVISWPGWHGPVADARHNGRVTLKGGLHLLEYLHVNGGASTCAVAAWMPPGAEKFEVIPETAFAPLSRAEVGPLELAGGGVAADFEAEIVGEALMSQSEEIYAAKMAFADTTAGSKTSVVHWDFGDGQYARGPSATHIYLASGVYAVTMRLGTGPAAASITQRIQVHQHWGWQTKKDIDDITAYFSEISRYDVEALDAPSCINLLKLADEQGSMDFAKRVALAAVSREGAAADDLETVTALIRRIMGPARIAADEGLIAAYTKAAREQKGKAKAVMARALSDIMLERGRAREAEGVLRDALAEAPDAMTKRRLFIAYADAARYALDAEAARNALLAAQEIPLDRSALQGTALGGAVAFAAEDYIARREWQDAEEALDRWDWEKPLEKLQGYSSYLRALVYQGEKREARSLAELEATAASCPESAYAPKALFLAAKIQLARGNREAARAALDKITGEYPASGEVENARQMLLQVGRR